VHATDAADAKLLGVIRVGQPELAGPALDTTNGLASGALGFGPLRLLVARGAGIRAHRGLMAAVTGDGSNDFADGFTNPSQILDARPAVKPKVVQRNGTIVRRERAAVKLAVGEVSIQACSASARGAARGSAGG
jgi:hypothetical protein